MSRDEVWKANIPHTHLAQEKSDQNWMVVNGDKINFPGGGTHFHNGADKYIVSLAQVQLSSFKYFFALLNLKRRAYPLKPMCLFRLIFVTNVTLASERLW